MPTAAMQVPAASGDVEDRSVQRCLRKAQVRRVLAGAHRRQRVVGCSLVAP